MKMQANVQVSTCVKLIVATFAIGAAAAAAAAAAFDGEGFYPPPDSQSSSYQSPTDTSPLYSTPMPSAADELSMLPKPGTVIKTPYMATLWYYAQDGKRYVFPNEKTYFTWYKKGSLISVVTLDAAMQSPLSGNVTYKPGARFVKITTDPKVYTVAKGGVLRWIKTEGLAKMFAGPNWKKLIDDIPDEFFTNYTIGEIIDEASDYTGGVDYNSIKTIDDNLK